ncbi:hypothetical protein GCM10010372_22630 [Streptomyces tauricus]|nr:hypothetical protein GCM10010372_22630 [Streptomyces tauricus]
MRKGAIGAGAVLARRRRSGSVVGALRLLTVTTDAYCPDLYVLGKTLITRMGVGGDSLVTVADP